MKIFVWNVRGFNNSLKQTKVIVKIRRLDANLVCLLETRVKQQNMQDILNK